jgi:hypothetical protein
VLQGIQDGRIHRRELNKLLRCGGQDVVHCSVLCNLGHCIGDLGSSHRSAPPAFIRIDLVSISAIVTVIIIAIVVIALHKHATLV